jgi:VanZ family protein
VIAWLPAVAWMAVIFFFSSRPMPPGTEVIPDWITHGCSWAILSVLLAGGLEASRVRRVALFAFLGALGYGILDELHQSYVPSRHADAFDLVKDAAGALAGLVFWQRWLQRLLHPEVT